MEPTQLFKMANSIAILGWIVMVVLHNRPLTFKIIFNGIIVLLCAFYAAVVCYSMSQPSSGGNFSSLEGVKTLFTNPIGVLAGWVHYLAFDMLTGLFIIYHSSKNNISRWAILPCLFFTFMLGPVGWLMYYITLCAKQKTWLPVYQ